MIEAYAALIAQMVGVAFACGLNLYATIAVIGLGARLDVITALPPGLSGLENGIVIGVAAALYAAGTVADRLPGADHLWEAVHTLIRPATAGLLVFLAFEGAPEQVQLAMAVAAAIVALAAHGMKAGVRMMLTRRWIDEGGRLRPQRSLARTGTSLLEDAAAAGVALSALLYPRVTIFLMTAAVAILLVAGPRLWRAALLGLRATIARARGFFGRPDWRSRGELPRAVRRAVPLEPLGRSPVRALPAAVRGLPGAGAYRYGWLVFTCDGPRFMYTSLFRVRCAELSNITGVVLRRGVLTDSLELNAHFSNGHERRGPGTSSNLTFFLLKDGPSPELAVAELLPGAS
jgi:hypothetical protein